MYEHPVFFSTLYSLICIIILQWYVGYPIEETRRRREQMRQHCKRLYDNYYNN